MAGQEADPAQSDVGALAKERRLQRLIFDSPSDLLPDIARGPLAAAMEVPVPREGPADVVVVDCEGTISLVECKRARNPEARRWVVGQLLGYAAWLWKLDYESFEWRFGRGDGDLARLKELPDVRDKIAKNLADGRFRLIVAADEINEWLKRAIVFLNAHTSDEVECLAVSIDPVTGRLEAVIGRDANEVGPYQAPLKGAARRILDGTESEDAARAAAGLLRWAIDRRPLVDVRFNPEAKLGRIKASGCTLFRIVEHRRVKVSLTPFGEDKQRIGRLRDELTGIDTRFAFEDGAIPEAPLEVLANEKKREAFLGLMERTLDSVIPP